MKKRIFDILFFTLIISTTLSLSVLADNSSAESDFTFNAGTITGYTGSGGNVVIPESIGGVAVTAIGNYAFDSCTALTGISFPDSIKSIGNGAFWGCSSLEKINFPQELTTLGSWAFADCAALKNVTLPSSLTLLSSFSFNGCSGLESISLPEGIEIIGAYSFGGCKSLSEINIPKTTKTIETLTFEDCAKLTSISLPQGIENIAINAFEHYGNLSTTYCYKDTAADNEDLYAYYYTIIEYIGDINNNSEIDKADSIMLLDTITKKSERSLDSKVADYSYDGKVDLLDVIAILRS